jgi:poly-beta-1,6-N-acetyl-D-glucosamine synthase
MILFVGFSVVHVIVFLWLIYHWVNTPRYPSLAVSNKTISILIPVRNEAENIQQLLFDINEQSYPTAHFEVIVIDDYSEDGTAMIVQKLIPIVRFDLKYIAPSGNSGKKAAIERGITTAVFDYIVTTDGDCSVKRDWLASYASAYESTDAVMITGPVSMTGKGLLAGLQMVEFSALIGFGAAALKSGNPSMCNGANISYSKSVFQEVGGYQGNEQIPSGDDEFLLQKVFKKYPNRIHFLKSERAIVSTLAKESISGLINQRVRWSSKWKFHKSWFIKTSAVFAFVDYLLFIGSVFMTIFGWLDVQVFAMIVALRWLVDSTYVYIVARFFKISFFKTASITIALEIFYPLFVALLGIASIFGKYSWKGRKYS